MVANGLGSGRLLGQALSALMTVAFAGMVVLQRRSPRASSIAVNAIGAFGSGLVGFALSPHPPIGLYEFGVLFLFGLTTIGLAFVLFMEGAKLHSVRRSRADQPARCCAGPGLGVCCLRREPRRDDSARRGDRAGGRVLAHGAGSSARALAVREDAWTAKNLHW